jgi:hypothetical protein
VNNPQAVIISVVLVVTVAVAIFLIARARKKAQLHYLQQVFGPEYSRVLSTVGDQEKAEAELDACEKRVERLQLVVLPAAKAAQFAQQWEILQTRFVDNPAGAVGEADRLVRQLMLKRGYPIADFERLFPFAADISVHHPLVVENYRAAQAIAARNLRGQASTEDLRKAVVHYRALFEDLLDAGGASKAQMRTPSERKAEAVQP